MNLRALLAALLVPGAGLASGAAGAAVALVPVAQGCAAATYTSHVTLVIEHADTRVIGLCIGFDGPSITGEQILQASGVAYATQSYGTLGDAVCQIDGEPASYGACLPTSGPYWAMFVSRAGGAWQVADRGISTETFADGDAEGFRYDDQGGPQPPPVSPAGICARALATSASSGAGGQGSSVPGSSSGAAAAGSGSASQAAPTAAAGSPAPDATATAGAQGAGATPAPAVISPAASGSGGVAGAVARAPRPASGIDPALLAAFAAGGGLAGLAVVRLARRRRA